MSQDWFAGTAPSAPAPRQHNNKKAVIVAVLAMAILAAIASAVFVVPQLTKVQCLDAEEYAELTDNPYPGGIDPTESFYQYPLAFTPASANYDNTGHPKETDIVKYLGEFYRKHKDLKPVYTLSIARYDKQNWYLQQERLDVVRKGLLAAGVAKESIVLQPVVAQAYDETATADDLAGSEADDGADEGADDIEPDTMTVNISSPIACTQ